MEDESVNVKVFCRFRPFNQREIELGADKALEIKIRSEYITITDPSDEKSRDFPFDYAFNTDTTQELVYEKCAIRSVNDVVDGYNGTIFAYGQTGAGKSWSMMGKKEDEELKGIIPRAAQDIFSRVDSDASGTEFKVTCSYLQVYREQIGDLLSDGSGGKRSDNLSVREHPSRGIYVDGLTEKEVKSWPAVLEVLEEGDENRAVAATNMNAVSSRSHSVFAITVGQTNTEGSKRAGRLNLVDLAGSEKVGKTGAKGQTLEEAKKINQSLSALGQVIKSLADQKKHVPYRDSKLTRILQEALGGNSKTSLIVACSPHLDNIEETISTLKFAERAKTIKNAVVKQETLSVAQLENMVKTLTADLKQMKAYCSAMEEALTEAGVDPKDIAAKAAATVAEEAASGGGGGAAPAAPLGGGGGGGGGGDPGAVLQLRTELAKLNEMLKIAQADTQEAKDELAKAQQAESAAMAEGGAAKEEMEKMALQREKERELAVKAIEELKKMHAKNSETNKSLKQVKKKEKQLTEALKKVHAKFSEVSTEKVAAETKLNTIQMKLDAMSAGGGGGEGGGDGDGGGGDIFAKIEETQKDLLEKETALAKLKEDSEAKADEDKRTISDLQVQVKDAQKTAKEVEASLTKSNEEKDARIAKFETETRELNLQVASLTKGREEDAVAAENLANAHRDSLERAQTQHEASLQVMKTRLAETYNESMASKETHKKEIEEAREAYEKLKNDGGEKYEAEVAAHSESKAAHTAEMEKTASEHKAAVAKLKEESAAALDSEREAHDKTRADALADKTKVAEEHLAEVTRLNAEKLAQLEAVGASQSDAAAQMSAVQAKHKEAVEKLAADNTEKLETQKATHAKEVEALKEKATAADAANAESLATLKAESEASVKAAQEETQAVTKAKDEELAAAKKDFAEKMAAAEEDTAQQLATLDAQLQENNERFAADLKQAETQQSEKLAATVAEWTAKFDAEHEAHAKTARDAKHAEETTASEHATQMAKLTQEAQLELKTKQNELEAQINKLTQEKDTIVADNATAVELLKSEQASKWGEREAAHAAEAGGLREELASTQAKAAEEVERLKSSHKQEMEEQLQASGASASEGAQALKEARERNEEHLKKVTEEHIAAIEKFKADNTAMAARAEEIRKNQELESKAKLEQLQRDSEEQLEKEREALADAKEEMERMQGLLNIGQESTKQLDAKDKELTDAQNKLRDVKKELQVATSALEAMEEDESGAQQEIRDAQRRTAQKGRELREEKKLTKNLKATIDEQKEQIRKLRDESLPAKTAQLFDLAVRAREADRFGAALRLLEEGADEAYDTMEDLEDRGDQKRLKQVQAALSFYTGSVDEDDEGQEDEESVMAQVRDELRRAPADEWSDTEAISVLEKATLLFARAAAKEVEAEDDAAQALDIKYDALWQYMDGIDAAKAEMHSMSEEGELEEEDQMEMEAALEKFQAKVDALKEEIGADSTETTTLAMVVPEGTYAGEEITVTTEDGEELDIVVPDGLGPGDEFEVNIEAEAAPLRDRPEKEEFDEDEEEEEEEDDFGSPRPAPAPAATPPRQRRASVTPEEAGAAAAATAKAEALKAALAKMAADDLAQTSSAPSEGIPPEPAAGGGPRSFMLMLMPTELVAVNRKVKLDATSVADVRRAIAQALSDLIKPEQAEHLTIALQSGAALSDLSELKPKDKVQVNLPAEMLAANKADAPDTPPPPVPTTAPPPPVADSELLKEMFDLVDENGDGLLKFAQYKKLVELTHKIPRYFPEQWMKTCEAQGADSTQGLDFAAFVKAYPLPDQDLAADHAMLKEKVEFEEMERASIEAIQKAQAAMANKDPKAEAKRKKEERARLRKEAKMQKKAAKKAKKKK